MQQNVLFLMLPGLVSVKMFCGPKEVANGPKENR